MNHHRGDIVEKINCENVLFAEIVYVGDERTPWYELRVKCFDETLFKDSASSIDDARSLFSAFTEYAQNHLPYWITGLYKAFCDKEQW